MKCLLDGSLSQSQIAEMDEIVKQVEKQLEKHPGVCDKQDNGRSWLAHNTVEERWTNADDKSNLKIL